MPIIDATLHTKISEFVRIDRMHASPEFGGFGDGNFKNGGLSGLDMTNEDLRMLGFTMLDPDDEVPEQRESKVITEYTAGNDFEAQTHKTYLNDSDSPQRSGRAPSSKEVNLVFRQELTIEAKMDSLNQSYQKHKEEKMRAVSYRMTAE